MTMKQTKYYLVNVCYSTNLSQKKVTKEGQLSISLFLSFLFLVCLQDPPLIVQKQITSGNKQTALIGNLQLQANFFFQKHK